MSPADAPPGRGPGERPRPPLPPVAPRATAGGAWRELPRVPPPAVRGNDPRVARTAVAAPRPRPTPGARPGAREDRADRRPPASAHRRGRPRRFVGRWGWRAVAIPLLTIATVLTLTDLAADDLGTAPLTAGAGVSSAPAPAATSPAAPEPTEDVGQAEGDAGPTGTAEAPATGFVQKGAGTVTVVPGTSQVYGTGPLERFAVEVEDGIGVDGAAFAAAVEATLGDPRSWGAGGRMSFQRVGAEEAAAGAYDFKVTLISPGNMELYCPGVGTGGYTSCRYGDRAVINLARWETAVPDYEGDVATYRLYVVNHEVGHALGNGHQQCPGPGQPAPVMQQQTLGLQGCARNAWPHP